MITLKNKSNSPSLNTSQLDLSNIADGTCINLFQGNLSLPVDIITLPGCNELNCDVSLLYQSQVWERINEWNKDDIPSVVGLGWDLSFPQIIRDSDNPSMDNYFIKFEGQFSRLIPSLIQDDINTINYELEDYKFEKITYSPILQQWKRIKEDGSIETYGGLDNSSSLQWGIRWLTKHSAWIGISNRTENQERYIRAWNLSRVENHYGNFYDLKYETKQQSIGESTLTYTKQSYIKNIQNDFGWSLSFDYKPMTYTSSSPEAPKEYLDLNSYDLEDDIPQLDYQLLQTQCYLESIQLSNDLDQIISSVKFDYYPLKNLTTSLSDKATEAQKLVYGATYKRYLKSIHKYTMNDESQPGIEFIYNWSLDSDQPQGSLSKIIHSNGGQSIFNYKKLQIGISKNSESSNPGARNQTILNPFRTENTASARVWYGEDYIVCTWYCENLAELIVQVWTWVGHWSLSPDPFTFEVKLDLSKLKILTCEDFFAISIVKKDSKDCQIYFIYRNSLYPTKWTTCDRYKYNYDTSQPKIVNGQNFFILYDKEQKLIDRFWWHPFERKLKKEKAILDLSTSSSVSYHLSATTNYYLIYAHDSQDKQNCHFKLYYQNKFFEWCEGGSLKDSINAPSIGGERILNLSASDTFISITSVTQRGEENFDMELKILMWENHFKNLSFVELPNSDDRNFQYLPNQILPYIGPMNIDNTVVSSGPNFYYFDGYEWHFQSIGITFDSSFQYPDTQFYWYGAQINAYLKTENTQSGIQSKLLSRTTDQWQSYVFPEETFTGQSERVKKAYPSFKADCLIVGTKIYSNFLKFNWNSIQDYFIFDLQECIESDVSIDTTTVINQSPFFIAFMTIDKQSGNALDTYVVFLKNGQILYDDSGKIKIEKFAGHQIQKLLNKNYQYEISLNGKLPSIPQGFVTFDSEDDKLENCQSITLHRYSNHSVQNTIQTFVIDSMIQHSGYNEVVKCYEYESVSAGQDATQTKIRFHKVIEYEGCHHSSAQTNGYTISYFANGIPQPNLYKHIKSTKSMPSILDGILITTEKYDSNHKLINFTEIQPEIIQEIPISHIDHTSRPLFGAFMQIVSKKNMLDGVTTSIRMKYLPTTGQLIETEMEYSDSEGKKVIEKKVFTYACEHYSKLQEQNRLKEILQTQIQTKSVKDSKYSIQYCKINIYKEWKFSNLAYWDISHEYLAKQATGQINWDKQLDDKQWMCIKSIHQRDKIGNVVECEDSEHIPTSLIYDDSGRFVIASFENASFKNDALVYESFENYQKGIIQYSNLDGEIYDKDAFIGKNCYRITKSGSLVQTVTLSPNSYMRSYSISVYIHAKVWNKQNTLQCLLTNEKTSEPLVKQVQINKGWFKFHWIINLQELKISDTLDIRFHINVPELGDIRFDQLIIRPIDSQFSAEVYDDRYGRIIGRLDNHAHVHRVFYSRLNDTQALAGPNQNVLGFRTLFLSRQVIPMTQMLGSESESIIHNSDFKFPIQFPNMELIIRGQKIGFYDLFEENCLENYEFHDCHKSDWLVKANYITLNKSSNSLLGARIRRSNFSSDNMAICVQVLGSREQTFSIGNGFYYILWKMDKWLLVSWKDKNFEILKEDINQPFGQEWIALFSHERIIFWCNGIKIFDTIHSTSETSGYIELGSQNSGSFHQLFVLNSVELNINFTDGFGNLLQSLNWESDQNLIINGSLYDSCGRETIRLKPARIENEHLNYRNNWAHYSLESIAIGLGIAGDINKAYPEDEGYPFEHWIYQYNPLDRIAKKGMPGKLFALTDKNIHYQTYSYGTNDSVMMNFKSNLPLNSYFVHTITDADGKSTHYYRDIAQNIIQIHQFGEKQNRSSSRIYDINGRLIRAIPPNYYEQNNNNISWIVEYSYDFLGRQIESNHPDIGQTLFAYDTKDRIRFYQDASARQNQIIHYIKYDGLSRIIEKGYITERWDQKSIDEWVKDSIWPTNGIYTIKYFYDGDDTTSNMLGNLWKTYIANGDIEDPWKEEFRYSMNNEVIDYERSLPINKSEIKQSQFRVNCQYDQRGQRISMYDNCTQFTIQYKYDSLGQLIELKPENSDLFRLIYNHTPSGEVQKIEWWFNQQLQYERNFNYNSCDWLTQVKDPNFQQQLTYTNGDQNYYNGNISQHQIQSPNIERNDILQIDEFNRLTKVIQKNDIHEWKFDLNNNWLNYTKSNEMQQFTFFDNTNQLKERLIQQQSTNYTYTLSGDISTIQSNINPTLSFQYYLGTQLVKSIQMGNLNYQLEYDSHNRRTFKREQNTSSEQYVYMHWESEKPIIVFKQFNKDMISCLRLVDLPFLTLIYDGQKYYLALKDYLNSTRLLLDQNADICGEYDYSPYGEPYILQDPDICYNYLFTDYEYDFGLGLYNAQIRFYDPQIGRFLMTDSQSEFFSPYIYVDNNPYISNDPTGRLSGKLIGWIAFSVGTVAGLAATAMTGGLAGPLVATLGATAGKAIGIGVQVTASVLMTSFSSQAVLSIANNERFFSKDLGISIGAGMAGSLLGTAVGAGASSVLGKAIQKVGLKTTPGSTTKFLPRQIQSKSFIKEVSGGVSNSIVDGLTNPTVSSLIKGEKWELNAGEFVASVGINTVSSGYKSGKKDSAPSPLKRQNAIRRKTGNSVVKSANSSFKSNSPTQISQVIRSSNMGTRMKQSTWKQNLATQEFSKSLTFSKDLDMDISVSPFDQIEYIDS